MEKTIRQTFSLCPVCGARLPAKITVRNGAAYIEKECLQHGAFSAVIWKNRRNIFSWYGDVEPLSENALGGCPGACAKNGLCRLHKNETCCVVLEVTERCNLHCSHCFAGETTCADRSFESLCSEIAAFVKPGRTLVQLSGGEPTLRDDLPELAAAAKRLGCKYVQLNSNGIRIAEDERYVKKLSESGVSFVFLQFDGTDDEIYKMLRGRPLFAVKEKAIENCAKYNLGVTLVPTIVPSVNDKAIGTIIRYGVSKSPAVRGVHFQPVAHIGRMPSLPRDEDRFTLDELMCAVESQSEGLVMSDNLQPSKCDHPMCGFHGDFIVLEDGSLHPLTKSRGDSACCCCGAESPADKNREFVGRRWQRPDASDVCTAAQDGNIEDMDYFLSRLSSHGFTITSMAFQDAGNMDIERLQNCSLHVAKNGKLVPFCVNYLTLWR